MGILLLLLLLLEFILRLHIQRLGYPEVVGMSHLYLHQFIGVQLNMAMGTSDLMSSMFRALIRWFRNSNTSLMLLLEKVLWSRDLLPYTASIFFKVYIANLHNSSSAFSAFNVNWDTFDTFLKSYYRLMLFFFIGLSRSTATSSALLSLSFNS